MLMVSRKLQTRTGPWPIGTLVRRLAEGSTEFSQTLIRHPRIYDDSEVPLMKFEQDTGGFRTKSCRMGRRRPAPNFEYDTPLVFLIVHEHSFPSRILCIRYQYQHGAH